MPRICNHINSSIRIAFKRSHKLCLLQRVGLLCSKPMIEWQLCSPPKITSVVIMLYFGEATMEAICGIIISFKLNRNKTTKRLDVTFGVNSWWEQWEFKSSFYALRIISRTRSTEQTQLCQLAREIGWMMTMIPKIPESHEAEDKEGCCIASRSRQELTL